MRFVLFLIGAVLGVYGSYWLANQTLSSLMAQCDNLIYFGIIAATVLSFLFFPIMLFREVVFEDSPPGWFWSLVIPVLYYSVVSIVLMWVISLVPFFAKQVCVNCSVPTAVRTKLDANETDRTVVESELKTIRDFNADQRTMLEVAANDATQTIAQLNTQKQCVLDGEVQEIRALYLLVGFTYDDLKALDPVDDASRASCEQTAQEANAMLDEMQKAVEGLKDEAQQKEWNDKLRDRRENVRLQLEKCKPETLMKQLSVTANADNLIIDVQLLANDGTDEPVEQMAGALQVIVDGERVDDVQVIENSKDDKACMLLVMDSSASIPAEEMPNIVSAVKLLNEVVRKRGDLYGIVTFGGSDEIKNYGLQQDDIKTEVLNRNGGYTAIWDAMNVGLQEISANCASSIAKRYVVLMTDGTDNDPNSKFMKGSEKIDIVTALHEQAVKAGTSVCVVAVSADTDSERVNLEKLVNNCSFDKIEDFSSLADKFRQIMGYERAYYRIVIPRAGLPKDLEAVRVRIANSNTSLNIPVARVLK
jgi:hypothetical protein